VAQCLALDVASQGETETESFDVDAALSTRGTTSFRVLLEQKP
jgi:hypothetical protein